MSVQRYVSAHAAKSNDTFSPAKARASARWSECLRDSDATRLWSELNRVVRSHPLVRAAHGSAFFEDGNRGGAFFDLTQELFVVLLRKRRFQHYLDSEMSDGEIELQIKQIELTNLLSAEIRKRYPESYRLAVRIAKLVRSSDKFRSFDCQLRSGARHIKVANRLYGLREWQDNKVRRGGDDLKRCVQEIPVRRRDGRLCGRGGEAQRIISNADLEGLIVSVLNVCDSPVDLRTLRGLVISRVPTLDIGLLSLSGGEGKEVASLFEPRDKRDNAEQALLQREAGREATQKVESFLQGLRRSVSCKPKQYGLMLRVLWHCYLRADNITQLAAAAELGVSDSLVSDYRRRLESELRALGLSQVEEARRFETALRERVSRELVEPAGLSGSAAPAVYQSRNF